MSDEPRREFLGLWIPKAILDVPYLSPVERLAYAEIESLGGATEQGCYASQAHMADRLGVPERTFRRAVRVLMAGDDPLVYQDGTRHRVPVLKCTMQYAKVAKSEVEQPLTPAKSEGLEGGQNGQLGQNGRGSPAKMAARDNKRENKEDIYTPSQLPKRPKPEKVVFAEADADRPFTAVRFTQDEWDRLMRQHGETVCRRALEKLSAYKWEKSKQYVSDAGAMRSWAIRAAYEELAKEAKLGIKRPDGPHAGPNGNNGHSQEETAKANQDFLRRRVEIRQAAIAIKEDPDMAEARWREAGFP